MDIGARFASFFPVSTTTNQPTKMKTYTIIENEKEYTVQASSQTKAMAIHFGCERPVKCMSYGDEAQLWGNRRYSKNTSEGYRNARFKA
jgi:hypothetical protein